MLSSFTFPYSRLASGKKVKMGGERRQNFE